MNATVKCGGCGVPVSFPDNASDHDLVKCARCGETLGTYREILDAVEESAAKKIEETLGRILKG